MPELKRLTCKTCELPIRPETVAHSTYAQSRPLCADCEDAALKSVRPPPCNRHLTEYHQR